MGKENGCIMGMGLGPFVWAMVYRAFLIVCCDLLDEFLHGELDKKSGMTLMFL
jgi:hypothetical protein